VGINFEELKTMKQSVSSGQDCFTQVILGWLNGRQEEVTREKLAHAVEVVGNKRLARNIRMDPSLQFTLPYLRKLLEPVKHRYNVLGCQLGLEYSEIKKFEVVRCDVGLLMSMVVRKWFELEGDFKPSMKLLKETLHNIDQVGLAQTLEVKYAGKHHNP